VTPRRFVPGFLIGLMALLVGWRIAAEVASGPVSWALVPAVLAYGAQFFEALLLDRRRGPAQVMRNADWALAFLRICAGFCLIPHFTEKLFAGPGPRLADAAAFESFGPAFPVGFVVLAGLCELGASIGVGLGLLTRLAGAAGAIYILIATLIGGHLGAGFIWASPGGGWEYAVLMMAIYLAFAAVGGGMFALDAALDENGRFPDGLRRFAFPRP
jgi:putative oxidoreductase